MFDAIAKPMASLLAFFYQLVPNYGVAIVLLTVAVMLLLTPFTVKSTRSMLAMQRLQPELKRLQAQHKNDRQALNEAMMAFYKEHNVNPLSGCLPMLLQMPVFFGLYEAIRGLTHNPPKLGHGTKLFTALCPNFDQVANTCGKGYVVHMKVLGVDLARTVSEAGKLGFAVALPFYVLLVLTTLTQYYQQRQISNRNPQAAAANPQMAMMQKVFPLVFLLIYIRIQAAVVVYFLVSNLLRIGQQGAMWKWDPKLAAEVAADVSEVESKSKVIDAKARPVKGKGTKPTKPEPRQLKPPTAGKSPSKPPPKPQPKGKPAPPAASGGNGSPKSGVTGANGDKPVPKPAAKPPGTGATGAGPARQRRKGR
jgi:YidC/Oxa1 family membrane protein insertase